jgi:hypothetical protein
MTKLVPSKSSMEAFLDCFSDCNLGKYLWIGRGCYFFCHWLLLFLPWDWRGRDGLRHVQMFRCLQQNGNDESPTTNTTTHTVLSSLLSLTGLEVKSLWGCYFWLRCNGVAKTTMEQRETFTGNARPKIPAPNLRSEREYSAHSPVQYCCA